MTTGGARALKTVAGCAISLFFIWLALKDIDLGGVWRSMQTANYLYVIPYMGCLVAIHFMRTLRWGILLEPAGKPTFERLNAASGVGFMALLIMPFRLGEMARPLLISERGKIRTSAAMASVVVERVVDGLAMAVVLVVALLFSNPAGTPEDLARLRWGGIAVFGAFLAVLIFLVFAYLQRDRAVGLLQTMLHRWPRVSAKVSGMLDAFIGALRILPGRRQVAWFWFLTAAYWTVNAFGMGLLARAFGLDMRLAAAFAVLGVLVVGIMIPAGPGMLGTFQAAVVFGMKLFFTAPGQEVTLVAYAWVLWACQFVQMVGFGMYFVLRGRSDLSVAFSLAPETADHRG